MGAAFRLPYHTSTDWPADLNLLKQQGYRVVAMHLKGSSELSEALSQEGPVAILLGAEYEGVSDAAVEHVDACVRIKMSANMINNNDSLNVHVAAAIVMHAAFALNSK